MSNASLCRGWTFRAAFRARLDAGQGYSGLLTKNPTHRRGRVARGPRIGYTLEELADCFDAEDLSFYVNQSKKPEEVGLGRNVTLFDWLRRWAYVAIRRYRTQRNQFPQWQAECYEKSLGRNGDFARPLDSRECCHVAKSVSRWTWRKDAEAHARFLARQAARGRKGGRASGVARLAASADLRASARLMHAQGISKSEISAGWAFQGRPLSCGLRGVSAKPKSDSGPVDLGKRRRER